jgi:hypothetical protein
MPQAALPLMAEQLAAQPCAVVERRLPRIVEWI